MSVISRTSFALVAALGAGVPLASAQTSQTAAPGVPAPMPAPARAQSIVVGRDLSSVPAPAEGTTLPQDPAALLAAPPAADKSALKNPVLRLQYKPSGSESLPGGVTLEHPTSGPLPLSLDDAIQYGLARNLRLKYQTANQRAVRGYQGQIRNAVIPNLELRASSSAQQLNLAALGFKPSSVGPLLSEFGIDPNSLQTIVKVNTTSAQLSLNQQLFNMPDYELFRAIKPEFRAVDLNVDDSREQLVQAVITAYLKVLADQANVSNALAQENSSRVVLDQATQRDQAGIGIRLDVLRAQVQYQQQQQARISAESQLDKDGIQLNRIMGLPAGQQIDLTDRAPFQELGTTNLDEARQTALGRRSDLLALQSSLEVASRELKAVRYQRLPTLAVNGYYGVLGETTGLYHGVFTAQGSLKVPVFREAGQRGEQESAEAQMQQLRDQEENLRGTIEAQLRTALLDVDTTAQLVKVARSNVELAQQELSDAQSRLSAGVTDNLEVVDAQSAVTGSEAQLVNALYQFNVAKVNLARGAGVLQTRYRGFLGM